VLLLPKDLPRTTPEDFHRLSLAQVNRTSSTHNEVLNHRDFGRLRRPRRGQPGCGQREAFLVAFRLRSTNDHRQGSRVHSSIIRSSSILRASSIQGQDHQQQGVIFLLEQGIHSRLERDFSPGLHNHLQQGRCLDPIVELVSQHLKD
jgi:hypothetical protein